MKTLLVSANRATINMPAFPLGLSCVAGAVSQAGHEVRIVDYFCEADPEAALEKAVKEFAPEVIGIGIRNVDAQNMLQPDLLIEESGAAVSKCRELSDAPVVLGGAGYSIFPESILAYCGADMGIAGEGEVAFPLLLEKMETDNPFVDVPGLVLPDCGISSESHCARKLDALPLPGYDIWASVGNKQDIWLPVQSRRGCPMDCSYCSTAAIEGRVVRRRSPENVVKGLEKGVEAGFSNFFFTD